MQVCSIPPLIFSVLSYIIVTSFGLLHAYPLTLLSMAVLLFAQLDEKLAVNFDLLILWSQALGFVLF